MRREIRKGKDGAPLCGYSACPICGRAAGMAGRAEGPRPSGVASGPCAFCPGVLMLHQAMPAKSAPLDVRRLQAMYAEGERDFAAGAMTCCAPPVDVGESASIPRGTILTSAWKGPIRHTGRIWHRYSMPSNERRPRGGGIRLGHREVLRMAEAFRAGTRFPTQILVGNNRASPLVVFQCPPCAILCFLCVILHVDHHNAAGSYEC